MFLIKYSIFAVLIILGFFLQKNLKNGELGAENRFSFSDGIVIASITLCTFVCLLTYMTDFNAIHVDSSVFIYIGRQMKHGFIPYKDMFDHKGLLLYFYNYLASLISENSLIGIYIIELVNTLAIVLISYKIAGLFTENRIIKYLSLSTTLILCGSDIWQGGNAVEEYAVPFIAYALYVFLKYFRTENVKMSEIFGIGIGLAAVTALRINMITVWAIFLPIILVMLIIKKQWKMIGSCAIFLILGMAVIFVPILIYLFATNSFKDMINTYFVFNFSYAGEKHSAIEYILSFLRFNVHFVEAVAALFIGFWYYKKDKIYLLNLLFWAVSMIVLSMGCRFYKHYGLVILPALIIPICACFEVVFKKADKIIKAQIKLPNKNPNKNPNKKLIISAICVISVLGTFIFGFNPKIIPTDAEAWVIKNTNSDDDVLFLGNWNHGYVVTERKTAHKYFYQDPLLTVNENIHNEIISEIENSQSDYIVVPQNKQKISNDRPFYNDMFKVLDDKTQKGKYEYSDYNTFAIYKRIK